MSNEDLTPHTLTIPIEEESEGLVTLSTQDSDLHDQSSSVRREESLSLAEPVKAVERLSAVDVIRGFALLGILAMNIVHFGWGFGPYETPILAEGGMNPDGSVTDIGKLNTFFWSFNHIIFDTKMMTLFSMLFGAGLVLMNDRASSKGASVTRIYFRRIFWLLIFGIIHACFIWDGDVLTMYALCAPFLFPFRKLKPRTLVITGLAFNLLVIPLLIGFRFIGLPYMRTTAEKVASQVEAKETPNWWNQGVHDAWKEMSKEELPKREDSLKEIARYRGPYLEIVKKRAGELLWLPMGLLIYGWVVCGRMLIGMGLMKSGVFAASSSPSTYDKMIAWGYGIGLPLMAFDVYHKVSHNFFLGKQLSYMLEGWPLITLLGSLPVVVGHIGLLMKIVQSGSLPWLTRRPAAVGRMALTNYLGTSIICTTLFYGYGFDLYATLHRPLLWAIVLAVWTLQLLLSPIWLRYFRFGPAEWLWRSLTYWKVQPMRATHSV